MTSITANNTAAFISYSGEWDDIRDEIRTTSIPGSTMTLEFSGTTLSAFGVFNPPNDIFTYSVDDQSPVKSTNATIQSPDEPFLQLHDLAKGHHSITFNLTNGTLGLSRLVWYDPQASAVEGSPIDPSNNSAVHTTDGQWGQLNQFGIDFWTTNQDLAKITFSFQGTGIVLMGLTGPEGGSFNATLDNLPPVIRNASSGNQHLAVLHRNDGLPNRNHNLTLTKTGGTALQVGQAHIFIASNSTSTTSTSVSPSSTETASTTLTPSWLPTHGGMSKGAVAGTVIGVLIGISLLAVILWLWLRRRLATSKNAFEKNRVTYARVCSKCRQDITGDYRLECVKPDCPAGIDLHPECKDWNVPERHDHEVHEVPNK
ncbi:hypothetical protein FRC08_010784 [Ceratobasidium sp. 394]|nr:hypothetical protein FRC08_010784 [Ceratobasidium sp. 394]KAG9096065.1 hypothetical protein FS749_009196 [Ceratobasidium sp. UAMH 11750]